MRLSARGAGIATGAAFSAKRLGSKTVTVCFFGDGALGQGLLYEVMNMAALWKLPVIYACENNLYGEYTKVEEMAAGSLTGRAAAFGIEAHVVDGQECWPSTASRENSWIGPEGRRPLFLQLDTYRFHGHHVGDINRDYYRTKEEEAFWKDGARSHPALRPLAARREDRQLEQLQAIEAEVRRRPRRPSLTRRRRLIRLPRKSGCMFSPKRQPEMAMREITLAKAVNEAIAEEMRRDPTVFVMGEDVAEAGHPFKVLCRACGGIRRRTRLSTRRSPNLGSWGLRSAPR